MSLSGHQSAKAKSVDWLTPPEIMAKMGAFHIDPCCPVNMPWSTASRHFTPAEDGLSQAWYGRIWMNPPFGREAALWMEHMAAHGNGIALIPARTETDMFYQTVWNRATAVLFLKGRPHFYAGSDMVLKGRNGKETLLKRGERAPFNSGAPICLVAYGEYNAQVLRNSGLGKVVGA